MVVGVLNEEDVGVRGVKEAREEEEEMREEEGSFESKRGVMVSEPADLCPGID